MESKEILKRVRKDIDRRNVTDLKIQPGMVLIVLLLYIFVALYKGTKVTISGDGISLSMVGVFVTGVGLIISIMYLFTSRRYNHDERDKSLMEDLLDYTRVLFEHYDIRERHHLNTMASCIRSESGLKRFRKRFLLSLVPASLGLILLVFNATNDVALVVSCMAFSLSLLMNVVLLLSSMLFPREHEKRFMVFSDAFVDAMGMCGIRVYGYEPVVGYRPFVLFFVLSVITFGLIFPIWLSLAMRDMNRHIDEQWNFENSVMRSLVVF